MAYKDVLAPVIELEQDQAALVAASEVARRFEAHAVALIVAVHLASDFQRTPHALSDVLMDVAKGSQSHAALLRVALAGWLQKAPYPFEVRDVTIEGAVHEDQVVAHARVADLVVMTRGVSGDTAHRALIEDVLFKSGRPMLLVPARPLKERTWEKIVIGWNAKAQAVRAVTAAMPMLQAAKHVVVATIDAKPSKAGHAEAPGRDLAVHLARHGVHVEVRNIDSVGRSHGRVLQDEAEGVDLLVLGAYGHSRAQEALFGGVTRELLADAPIPLLLAH